MECKYSFDPSVETEAELDTTWECPHEAYNEEIGKCVFHMSEDQREKNSVTSEDLVEKIKENLEEESAKNEYIGADLPRITLTYDVLDGDKNHVINLQHSSIEALNISHGTMKQGLNLKGSEIGTLNLEESHIHGRIVASNVTVENFKAEEAIFHEEVHFENSEFRKEVEMSEAEFRQDMSFRGSHFLKEVDFRNIITSGNSHELEDHADFRKCKFSSEVHFSEAHLNYVTLKNAEFEGYADFNHTVFEGDAILSQMDFKGKANFNDTTFNEDVSFKDSEFRGKAEFKGSKHTGGSRATEDDTSFQNVVFHEEADFHVSEFRYANFALAEFKGRANFQEVVFNKDADFHEMKFEGDADFDETRFLEDADFHNTVFEAPAVFRGAIFDGEAEEIEENALFQETVFHQRADFESSKFTSANFEDARFGDECNFSDAHFRDSVKFKVHAEDNDTYVNLTNAEIRGGVITEVAGGIVPYDLTRAILGDVRLEGENIKYELLDYFRFCLTDFEGFDWSNHHTYLERNNWDIHTFVQNQATVHKEVEMTNEVIEETYRKAQVNADEIGDKEAMRNFEFKRWYYNRQKNWDLVRNEYSLDTWTRVKKAAGVGLNLFMQYTCGYANKVPRIFGTMAFFTTLYGVLYTLGGPLKTGAGVVWNSSNPGKILFDGIYYSGVTFTTIGYGGIGPHGWAAKLLAVSEGYLSAILFTLLTVTLLRSAIGSS
ncbi:MAG: pentapeptide repeat-containing protein [Candidatus Nanohalobium sp.]